MQILHCPSDSASVRFNLPGMGHNLCRSYSLAYNVAKASYDTTTHETRMVRPSSTVLLAENNATLGNGSNPATWMYGSYVHNWGEDVAWRHRGRANFLFVNGHVKAVTRGGKGPCGKEPFPTFPGYTHSAT